MIDTPRGRDSLEKLLKLARGDADALRIDLVDIERARKAAADALDGIDEDVRREEKRLQGADGADFAAFIDGVRERRKNLQTTLMTLGDAEDEARGKLKTAFVEIKKLEHLVAMNMRDAKKTAARKAQAASDDMASTRAQSQSRSQSRAKAV